MANPTVKIYDASLQEEVDFTLAVDLNGEIVATSTKSERQLKFPAGLSESEFKDEIANVKAANEGQDVVPEDVARKAAEDTEKSHQLLDALSDSKKK